MPRLSELYARRLEARRREIERKTLDIAEVLRRHQREVLGESYPPASRPGQPPRKRSGRLQREATVKANPSTSTVSFDSTAVPYARYLKATRPWQDLTLARARPEIDHIEKRNMPFPGDT